MNLYNDVGYFPSEMHFKVGEQFLESEILFIKIKRVEEEEENDGH